MFEHTLNEKAFQLKANRSLANRCMDYDTYVTVLSLLEMHSGGNVRRPRCRPSSLGILGASDLILIYYWDGLCNRRCLRAAVLALQYSDT